MDNRRGFHTQLLGRFSPKFLSISGERLRLKGNRECSGTFGKDLDLLGFLEGVCGDLGPDLGIVECCELFLAVYRLQPGLGGRGSDQGVHDMVW